MPGGHLTRLRPAIADAGFRDQWDFLVGAGDMVSVYVRETLIQVWTPDAVRGRVNAVNMVFVGASNELGEFRAGVMAAWTSAVFAVTFGGIGTMAVAGLWAHWFPELRGIRSLDGAGGGVMRSFSGSSGRTRIGVFEG